MRKTVVRAALAALALVATAQAAEAQIRFPKTQLIVGVGRTTEMDFGELVVGEGSSYSYHHPTTVVDVGLQTASPLKGVDLRATFQYARPRLDIVGGEGVDNSYRSSVKTLTLDAVVRGPRILDARLYALGGVGVRHFDFKQSYLNDSRELVGDDELMPVLHLGAGINWNVGRYDLFVEAADYIGRYPAERVLPVGVEGKGVAHQPAFTAGFRIPLN